PLAEAWSEPLLAADRRSAMNGPPAGMVTFLLTDVEGSTRLWEASPDRMQAALARHDRIVRQTIEEHGGTVFKALGDSFYAAFTDPLAAVQAALAVQRALQDGVVEYWSAGAGAREVGGGTSGPQYSNTPSLQYSAPLRVRIALHTGE